MGKRKLARKEVRKRKIKKARANVAKRRGERFNKYSRGRYA